MKVMKYLISSCMMLFSVCTISKSFETHCSEKMLLDFFCECTIYTHLEKMLFDFFGNALFTHVLRSFSSTTMLFCAFTILSSVFRHKNFLCYQVFNFYMIKINYSYELWFCMSKNFKFNRQLCWNNESNLVSVHLQVRNHWIPQPNTLWVACRS